MGMGEEARGRLWPGWGETEAGDEEAGVRVRDARSGNSRDFFLFRRDLCTRLDDGTGLPPLLEGDCVRRVGES